MSQSQTTEKRPVNFGNLILGGCLHLFEVTTLGQPMEVIKTRMAADRGESLPATLRGIGLAEALWVSTKVWFRGHGRKHRARALCFFSGIFAGMTGGAAQAYTVMGTCTRMKTVEITKRSTTGNSRISTWTEVRNIWNKDGIRGINKGAHAVALRQMSNWGSRFGFARLSEDAVRDFVNKEPDQKLSPTEKVFCAAVGGGLACWNQPIEVVRVEMQSVMTDPNRPKNLTTLKTMGYIYSSSGIRGLYRGVLPRMSLGIWQTICLVALGDMAKEMMTERAERATLASV